MRKPGVAPLIDSRSKLSATKLRCGRHRVSLSDFFRYDSHLVRRGKSTAGHRQSGIAREPRQGSFHTPCRVVISSRPWAPKLQSACRATLSNCKG